jgi:ribonuclease Z
MFTVQILGNSSATPAFSRFTSAQVVNYNDRYYLVDCGEGLQMQLFRYKIRFSRIDALFISHMHGDHVLGAPGLLSTLHIFEREAPLHIFGPQKLQAMLEQVFQLTDTQLRYPLVFHALEQFAPGEVIFETDKLEVRSIPLTHHVFCRGFLFQEKIKKRKFDYQVARELDIPKQYFHLLKQGNDVELPDGRQILAEGVLFPREPSLSYAYCSDTVANAELIPYIQGVNLLYHEATFMENMRDRAEQTLHSTTLDAAQAACDAEAHTLVIGHFSARYHDLEPLLMEARSIFPRTELALEGRVFDLKHHV